MSYVIDDVDFMGNSDSLHARLGACSSSVAQAPSLTAYGPGINLE